MRKLTVPVIILSAVCSLTFLASCNVKKTVTVETDFNISINGSEIELTTSASEEMETTMIQTSETSSETTTTETQPPVPVEDLSPEWVRELPQAKDPDIKQLVVVAADGMNETTAHVSMHEKDEYGNWIEILSVDGYVGKNGMVYDSERKEGCGRTPIGVYHFNKAFGIASDPGCAIPYIEVTDDLYWSGDMRDGMHYNEMVSINDYPGLDTENSEHLISYTKAYQYCLNISFNEECTSGRGSAIFLHCKGNNPYTAGCVAVSEDAMIEIMQNVDPDCVVVIDTVENLNAEF